MHLDRRGFLKFAGITGAAAALAACGGPSTGGGGPAAVPEVDYSGVQPAKEITWWTNNPGSSETVSRQIIDAYQRANPGTKVNLVTAGATYEEIAQRFQTAQAGGGSQLPDLVVLSDVWWFRYYMQRSIVPMDPLIAATGIDTADYRQQLIEDYRYDGKLWALPWARSTPIFYYNKAHWQKAGLPDRAPATWAEMAEWGPRLQAAGTGAQKAYQLPALADYAGWSFQNNLWGEGGAWSDEWDVTCDSPEAVRAVSALQNAVTSGWAGVAATDGTTDLGAGAVSATVGSTGSLVTVLDAARFDVGAGFLPAGPVAGPVCPTGGAGLGIPAGVPPERQLAAAAFAKFLTSPENTVLFSQATGYLPLRTSADTGPLLAETPLRKIAIDQLDRTRTQDRARAFFPGADQEIARTCANILNQRADVQGELTTLKGTLTRIFDTDVKPNI
ncbi:ABC transporter substrate-binding protein [Pseudonocardia alni]|jgi:sn-glycerol 3-phosphate transport system substrate-binding protein|uniref:Sn-glycerol 3-phosphate transport system substrate-binding protein n=1 Tax=Pseudonocardia alni TaxID=33907 RepID=A0A852W2H3_PSEA5|nr:MULTISPECIES: ABC transporter substrate-binding protein [Pseudonocardia]MCO7193573.1 ABC transporter substrate-binding protein [Pseudonocardia sp. McavD-2-B]MYW72156.1 extracellular solute-binding protein [Pseudonocardia sp. SID8383]NYG00605.1 sn-glycerol 3-phosphate transport system substrate-binding protein [Pseudonocardia antarctica]OJG05245.1 sn-glycerol-3-phosphate-binding periplasmic protein UgpB precursor [Pseudonocardia autotrophica]